MAIIFDSIIVDGKVKAGRAATLPGVPTNVIVTAGNTTATVSFTAPVSDGGSAITGYTVYSSPVGGTDSNAGSTSLSHTVTGLINGVSYTFYVVATNEIGSGANSTNSNSVVPATVPSAPTSLVATAGNTTATVTFTASSSNGGSTITGYTLYSFPPGGTDSNAGSTGLSHTITGLTNNTSYTFYAVATNAIGNSANSANSNSITPIATDPYWTGVALLLTGETATITPIETFSQSPKSVLVYNVNNTENSATQFKFGTKSVWKKDNTSVLSWNDNSSYPSHTGPIRSAFYVTPYTGTPKVSSPFTIESFYRSPGRPNIIFATVLSDINTSGGWSVRNRFDNGNYQFSLTNYSTGGGSTTANFGVYDYAALNTWVNFAVTFDGTTTYMFVDGQLIGSLTGPNGVPNKTGGTFTGFRIGNNYTSYWDETRLTMGICRYTSNYTVATEPYPQV